MSINKQKEVWKEVQLNLEFDVDYILQVSNLGNVRSINKYNQYKILKPSLSKKFRILNRKFFRDRTKKEAKSYSLIKFELDKLKKELAKNKKAILSLKYKSKERNEMRILINQLDKTYKTNLKSYQKYLSEERKIRTINKSWWIHKLVALYFCVPKSKKHTYLIHLDHNTENNIYTNLKWVTYDEYYSFKYNLMNRSNHKKISYTLTIEKVKEIRNELKQSLNLNLKDLAHKYNISLSQLQRIKNFKTWNFVKN